MLTSEVLRKAADRLEAADVWFRGNDTPRRLDGTFPTSDCAFTAIANVVREDDLVHGSHRPAVRALADFIYVPAPHPSRGYPSITPTDDAFYVVTNWNDKKAANRQEVIDAMRAAARKQEEISYSPALSGTQDPARTAR